MGTFFEPFDEDMLNEAVRFAERWELRENLREQRCENLVAPSRASAARTAAGPSLLG
jgi:hypothetical protein